MPADAEPQRSVAAAACLLRRKRPVVIDLAVFIDGKSFRETREAWIDEVLASGEVAGRTQAKMPPGINRSDRTGN